MDRLRKGGGYSYALRGSLDPSPIFFLIWEVSKDKNKNEYVNKGCVVYMSERKREKVCVCMCLADRLRIECSWYGL